MFKGLQTIQTVPEFIPRPINDGGAWSPDVTLIPPDQINRPKARGCSKAVRSRAFLDIAQPRRDRREELNVSPSTRHSNFIDLMINDNRDLWDRLMNNPFCARMGNGTARLEGFKDYAIGEFIFLRNYVRYKLGLYSKTDDWDVLSTEASISVAESVNFANLQLEVCIQELNIPEAKVLKAEPKPKVKAYIDWVNSSIKTEDWFSLHVLMAPCILGYFDIATKMFDDPTTKRGKPPRYDVGAQQ
ncbi:unnamed protein product [Rhizoctonia solani]|uniref:Thiaminase-2/PQQC domain-containing protein n=1 Tax=Rhizoctonia solani TaxID=456999 RepID=A0A8H3GFV0_9AGAM|nr:unnamed protein product [Rhizoctonia solani]